MYIYEINWEIFEKCLVENEYVILGILSEDTILNKLFMANLKKLNKLMDNHIVIGVMNLCIYRSKEVNNRVTPRINLYRNNQLIKEVIGFKKCRTMLEELEIFNLRKKTA